MRVLINLEDSDDIREVYLDLDQPLEMLKYLIEAEFNITINNQTILYENKILENDKFTLINYNIKEDEIIVVRNKQTIKNNNNKKNNIGSHNINTNNISKIFDDTMKMLKYPQNLTNSFESRVRFESIRIKEFYINNPVELNILFNTDPDLAEVIVSMDDKRLEELLRTRMTKIEDKKKKEQEEYAKLIENPDDKETQKRIEEIIRLKNIDENLKMAHEYLPESFLPVHMLYINLEINRNKVVALVDTGAQTTVISENLAKKFEIFNLCDTRYSGIAKGVGTSKIIGKIHAAQMKIGER